MTVTRHRIEDRQQWLEMRRRDITASEVGALFGVHPYKTAAELFADKAGLLPPAEAGNAATRGVRLEPFVASQIQEKHPDWKIEKATEYWRDGNWRIGATPDYFVTLPDGRRGPMDIKTVDERKFKEVWMEADGSLVPEPFILLQVVQQMHLTGGDFGMVGVMPVSSWAPFDVHVIDVPQSPKVVEQILARVNEFWVHVLAGKPPEFDPARDLETVKAIYSKGGGEAIDLRGDNEIRELLHHRERHKKEIASHQEVLEGIETKIRAKIGNAEEAIVNGWHLTLKTSQRKGYTVEPTVVRTLRAKRLHSDRILP